MNIFTDNLYCDKDEINEPSQNSAANETYLQGEIVKNVKQKILQAL